MSTTWPKTSFVKVHEGCGGLVRWVEAMNKPGVHYTGQCQHCSREGIPMEQIIPLEYGTDGEFKDAIHDMTRQDREQLAWDEDADFDENQARLREQIEGAPAL